MQTKQKQSKRLPARATGDDLWSPWIEMALDLGRAWWSYGSLFPADALPSVQVGPAPSSPVHPGRLVLVHSSATVVVRRRKPQSAPPRLVVRRPREDA